MISDVQTSIVLHGGFGNQLFQWAFGHHAASKGLKVDFVFYNKTNLVEHTREPLQKLLQGCAHGRFRVEELSKFKFIRILQDPTHPKSPFQFKANRICNTLALPFTAPSLDSPKRYYFGYYQNSTLVHDLENILIRELEFSLNLEPISPIEKELIGAEVIHIRQGDTMTPTNLQRVGVLDSEYYARMPSKSSKTRVVVTDDVKGATLMFNGHQIDAFLGPEDLDVRRSLGVMSRSSLLFTANSTLSWWGGVLALNRGANVFIPDPFFRNVQPPPGRTFQYPGFQTVESSFLDLY